LAVTSRINQLKQTAIINEKKHSLIPV